MRVRLSIVLIASALFGAACTSPGEAAPAEDVGGAALDSRSGSLGILQVERLGAAPGSLGAPPAQLGAAFARYQGLSGDAVVRLLGGRPSTALDACLVAGGELDGLASADASVELLDVGAIDVRVGDAEARLVPRTFPELARVAAGFFYAGDASLGAVRADVDAYTFRAEGSADLPGFEVAVPVPAELVDVRLDGAPLTELPNGSGTLITRDRDLEVTWEGLDPRDQVEVELVSGGATVVCRARDDGAFRVPASALTPLSVDESARLVLRRVRVQPFDAAGVDVAYVRLASTRVFDAVVR
jgi:hypothetical protein